MKKNNILTHKFFPIIVLAFFVLFIFNINCLASTNSSSIKINNFTYDLSSYNEGGIIIYNIKEDNLYLYQHWRSSHGDCGTVVHIITENEDTFNFYSYCDHYKDLANLNTYKYNKETNTFEIIASVGGTYSFSFNKSQYKYVYGFNKVYTDNTLTTEYDFTKCDFFLKTPLQGVQVVEITQVEEIPKAIAETMKTIIPIGLIVLSIFLIIYLMKSVIFRQM